MIARRSSLRRRQPRGADTWPVTVFSNNRTVRGEVGSIGGGGAFLCLDGRPERDDIVRIVIEIPDRSEVVTAQGTVVGAFALTRDGEQPFPFAVAVEFTEISDRSRRLIAALHAPAWHRDLAGSGSPGHPVKRYAVFGILLLGVALSLYLAALAFRGDTGAGRRIERIAERLESMESQLKSLHSAQDSLAAVAERIDAVHNELDDVKASMPAIGKDQPVRRLEGGEGGDPALDSASTDASRPQYDLPAVAEDPIGPTSTPAYHVVRKGENLYRISLNYHLKIDYLRQVNGLDAGSQIYPGQILLVK